METSFTSNGPSIVGARIGGLLTAVAGLATVIIQGFVLKTVWIFGVAPGFSMAGNHIGMFVRVSGTIVGLIWLALGVLMVVMAVKRLVLVVAVSLVAAVLFLLVPGIESMVMTFGWSFLKDLGSPVAVLTVLLPVVIVIGLCLCLWLARSGGPAAKAVTMVVLSLAVLLAVSCAVRVFGSLLWCYYLLTSGLFTIGWVVTMAGVPRPMAPQTAKELA